MIIDSMALPLRRIWCLFEVYQTIRLAGSGQFQGLLLCTSTGILQEGKAGADVSVAVGKTVAELDTRSAEATDEEDRAMIHSLIEKMPGGFDAMNSFVRDTICKALEASHVQYENAYQDLLQHLASVPMQPMPADALPSSPVPLQSTSAGALPTLLTSPSGRQPGAFETKNF